MEYRVCTSSMKRACYFCMRPGRERIFRFCNAKSERTRSYVGLSHKYPCPCLLCQELFLVCQDPAWLTFTMCTDLKGGHFQGKFPCERKTPVMFTLYKMVYKGSEHDTMCITYLAGYAPRKLVTPLSEKYGATECQLGCLHLASQV